MVIKCKPVYNFQSVEFEMEIDPTSVKDLEGLFTVYNTLLQGLQKIAVDQPGPVKQAPVKKEPMATEKQVACLTRLGVPENEAKTYTATMANRKINELLNK